MRIGRFDIRSFVERSFKLDGGAMFGIVPKTLWQKLLPADETNLISMRTNLFVMSDGREVILFETGLGDTLSDKEEKIYGVQGESQIDAGLDALGLKPSDITLVILTHLHTDHAGGAVKANGKDFVPRFSNARYVASQDDWDAATNPNERTRAVYDPKRYQDLRESGQLDLINGSTTIMPGIKAVHTGGHTEGHFGLEIESEGQRLFYYSDILPTSLHLPVAWVPATDLFPLQSMSVKRALLPRLLQDSTVVAFNHDTTMAFGRVKHDGQRYRVEPVKDE